MRPLFRTSALLFVAVLSLSLGFAQAAPQEFRDNVAEFQAHALQGSITAISGGTITVKTEQGEIYSILTGPNTHFRKQRDEMQISGLHVGDMIVAFGDKDPKAKTLGAAFVAVLDKARFERMRAEFGKTWTAGVVESINGTNIVIKRSDNVTQTIAVDENTSFRRRREDITLLDIKSGDTIGARGSLKDGTFLATEVRVGRGSFGGGPGPHGAWHRPNTDAPNQNN